MKQRRIKTLVWEGCYDSQLVNFIVPDAFGHPAKFSLGLIQRIYFHLREKGWLKQNDVIGDPFGGVGIGGMVAAYQGLAWIGVELEPRFVTWAELNFAKHARHWETLKVPMPRIFRGDSRNFAHHVHSIVTSPPYAHSLRTLKNNGIDEGKLNPTKHPTGPRSQLRAVENYGESIGQIEKLKEGSIDATITSPPYENRDLTGQRNFKSRFQPGQKEARKNPHEGYSDAIVTSPPYADSVNAKQHGIDWSKMDPKITAGRKRGGDCKHAKTFNSQLKYGSTPGQIGALKAIVSSPPYAETLSHGGGPDTSRDQKKGGQSLMGIKAGYGVAPGNIGELKAVVSSPPWESNCEGGRKKGKFKNPESVLGCKRGHGATDAAVLAQADRESQKSYGETQGNIGNTKSETYWDAMRMVYQQCFQAIRPGGVIAIVIKDYVKNKKLVPLCDDTARLLEHIGFVQIERIHAMLVAEETHGDLFLGQTTKRTERKSFFRRLAEAKGSPKIDFEQVLILKRP